jgi:regulator of cell morphogenesis and NO signaling
MIDTLAARVARAHGAKSQALVEVREVVADLVTELTTHMQKEEVVLFPMIRRIEAGQAAPMPLDAPIHVMEREHDHAGDLLQRLRVLTDDYVPPPFACDTLRALYRELDALEQAMHVHVHLENNVLFPRAVEQSHGASR